MSGQLPDLGYICRVSNHGPGTVAPGPFYLLMHRKGQKNPPKRVQELHRQQYGVNAGRWLGWGSPVDPDIARNPLRFARLFFQQNRFALSYLFSYFLKIQS